MRTWRLALVAVIVAVTALGIWLGSSHGRGARHDSTGATSTASTHLVALARAANPSAYRFDLAHGARVVPSPATGTYTVASTTPSRPRALVVVVHGHAGNPFAEYRLWQPFAARQGYGLVSVAWQRGFGQQGDYLAPRDTYAMIERAVRAQGVAPGHVLLHGFSMGSHAAFELTALDRAGPRLFAMTIAESGGAHDLPASLPAFAGTRWVLYCAGHDQWPDISGCPAMRRAAAFLRRSRASISHFIVDPPAKHGGFLLNPADVERALADFRLAMAGG